jgi:thiol-disulfide isomerase/thioredoxin
MILMGRNYVRGCRHIIIPVLLIFWILVLPARAQTSSTLPSTVSDAPCTSATVAANRSGDEGGDSPFAINSPFDVDYKSPLSGEGKRLWAKSFLWEKAPALEVDEWITSQTQAANLKGKYLLIEIWASWCSQSRKAIPLLNALSQKYGGKLAIIAVSDEPAATVRAFARKTPMHYALAVDPAQRMKRALGVTGIPHVIIVEPGGTVVWEGFPLLKDFELTGKIVGAIVAVKK